MKYEVWAKINKKWVLIETFTNLQKANHKMREMVYLYGAEAASVERSSK